jgi:hypothetical protein
MGDIGDQYPRAIYDRRVDDEVKWSDRDIEDDRVYRCMEECCPSSGIDMREYTLGTPEVDHIAHRECEECDHSKEYRRYTTPE